MGQIMTDRNEKVSELLRRSLDPVNPELSRDLWPEMQRRMEPRTGSRTWIVALFSTEKLAAAPWFDWVALATLVVAICLFPQSIPIWLYHL